MWLAQTIADAFSESGLCVQDMVEDAAHDLGFQGPWLTGLAERMLSQIEMGLPHRRNHIYQAIVADENFQKQFKTKGKDVRVPGFDYQEFRDEARSTKPRWKALPAIGSISELAELLGADCSMLHWFIQNHDHYDRKWLKKRSTGFRLIEAPRPLLKSIQRKIHHLILQQVPSHRSAHGFCPGGNVVDFVKPHLMRESVLKFDLKDFFPTLRYGRVLGLFKMFGFNHEVSSALTKLCTTHCPSEFIDRLRDSSDPCQMQELRRLYLPKHLPQGAPTSPMLANHCAFRLDARLTGYATNQQANYTRYADDLLFSGNQKLGRNYDWFASVVGAIALEEGFELNYRKSRLMRASTRQSSAGVILNAGPNIDRKEFDRLKAILHNCVLRGPESQNREYHPEFRAHLAGKIGWVTQLNPKRGAKLQKLFDQIAW